MRKKQKKDQYFIWEEKYKPILNHIEPNAPYNGTMFETYDEEEQFVRSYPELNKIWTLLEGDKGQYIVAGRYYVNRVGYFITEIPWETGTEEFYDD